MMGALHIEDKMHAMIGKLLRGSGWSIILTQAQVLEFTSWRAKSVLDEHHIKRTRYAHQVSAMFCTFLDIYRILIILLVYKGQPNPWKCGLQEIELKIQYSCSGPLSLNWNYSCAHSSGHFVKETFRYMFSFVMSFAHGFMRWTTQIMHVGC